MEERMNHEWLDDEPLTQEEEKRCLELDLEEFVLMHDGQTSGECATEGCTGRTEIDMRARNGWIRTDGTSQER
jgi:hypothetical protein